MTWSQIKQAVEEAGVSDTDEIIDIQCKLHDGDKTLRKIKLGRFVKLAEDDADYPRRQAAGCAC